MTVQRPFQITAVHQVGFVVTDLDKAMAARIHVWRAPGQRHHLPG
jgi:hypothetical protein